MSHFLVISRKTSRGARDTLRRVMWTVLIWTQHTNPEPTLSRFQTVVDSLPRHLLEHEKALIRTFVCAFGFDAALSNNRFTSLEEPFFKFYIRAYSSMKSFFSWNPKAMGISSASSTNLFLAAYPCLVPVDEIDKILARIFSVSISEGVLFVLFLLISSRNI